MKTISATLLAFIFAFAFVACENNNYDDGYAFDDWDDDSDELVDQDEFGNTFSDAGYYDDWDLDNDEFIDEDEWQSGVTNNFDGYDYDTYGEFSDWDTDNDNLLDEDELVIGNFTVWDTDRDGNIEVAEYEEWSATDDQY
ncbi:hypothetical protein GCM10009122_39610 [Fulvivirga kasyanovii]|uniref:EF-hand domain-containing protein n=1 Tax=Fulvivirga kasyanovii TaxID=396812 RepID=A0ABW9RHW2_9BACT|nr:hypothetical protein [Fulvivirga kasyanovii]MTI23647.1 hypothetical protein [Fulvivirga kasyanovii]